MIFHNADLSMNNYPGLYMIGYGKGKIILKFPPFFRLNEENQEREIQNQIK